MKKTTYLLIDSHALIHRAYHAMPFLQTKQGIPSGALYGLTNMLVAAIEKFNPDYIFAANDLPKTTFREMAFKDYKGHRSKTDDALVEQIIRMPTLYEAFGIPLLSQEGYEADDVIGTLVKKVQEGYSTPPSILTNSDRPLSKEGRDNTSKYQIVILTGDMDIMQLIDDDKVVVYTAKKGEEEIIYHEGEVMKKYGLLPKQIPDYKGLRGDTSDNIPGIKGIGEKTALTILQKGETLDKVYQIIKDPSTALGAREFFGISERMFELLKNGEEDAEFSKALATISCDIEVDIPKVEKYSLAENFSKLKDFCEEYGFLSIRKRLEKMENLAAGRDTAGEVILDDFAKIEAPDPRGSEEATLTPGGQGQQISFSSEGFKKVQIALWLLDSSETNIDQERANYLLGKILPPPPTPPQAGGELVHEEQERQIVKHLEQELEKRDLKDLYFEMELPLIEILNESNRVGIKVDREKLQELLNKYEKTKEHLVKEIYKLAGREFNINSPKQMGEVLFEEMKIQDIHPNPPSKEGAVQKSIKLKKTKGGKISTNAAVLEEMKDNHEIVQKLLDYRETEKMINTYLEPLLMHSTFDGRIHTTFIQTGAATGRFASTNPNMQNIPVKGEEGKDLRKCFIASPGKILIASDYSQIELRCAGILSGDPYLVETYKKGEDIHTMIACKMFNKEPGEITKDERNAAKAMNFGIFYGMGVTSIKNTLKVERNVAQAFYDSYTQAVALLMKYLHDTIAKTKDTGFTQTLYGRERQVKELFSNIPMIRAQGDRIAMNAPIQGTSADIIKWAMVDFHKVCIKKGWTKITPDPSLSKEGSKNQVDFLLQIHDEILFEVDKDMEEEVSKELKKVMEAVIENHKPKIEFTNIPIVANVKSGKNWGEM